MASTPRLRRTLTTLGVAGFAGASLLAGAGTATAATTASQCTQTVSGSAGDKLRLDADAVKSDVINSVSKSKLPLLGKSDQDKVKEAYAKDAIKDISLGSIPKGASAKIPGSKIADATLKRLAATDDLEGVAKKESNRNKIRSAISDCTLTVKIKKEGSGKPSEPGSSKPGDSSKPTAPSDSQSSTPTGGAGDPAKKDSTSRWPTAERETSEKPTQPKVDTSSAEKYNTGSARQARRDYSDIPFAKPGTSKTGEPFNAEQFDAAPKQPRSPYLSDDVDALGADKGNGTGQANELDGQSGGPVPLPLLIAVVSLAGAAAALVRTWVLRRT